MDLEAQGINNFDLISYSSHKYKNKKEIINKGCILCTQHLYGNLKIGYRCKNCNIIYSKYDLTFKIPNYINEEGVRKFR